ncbi:methionine--tRNA ligase [Kitasatospora viridis]|uniref:Methionine--tRNA ligase n=1 Tax=Kitasatospora viridis TaxID=281105 RepID=A0A561UBP6_9ACTN|nr:methionine--tRNA ligase [Kitasatospora viridis]TWF96766.1 methionyl-tRNA synthetase [Kitasatospora viridis]
MTTRQRSYLTTTLPYVNARPHLGFALELVQADVLARHRRASGGEVRLLGGTDENSLKNVLAAGTAGTDVRTLVARHAAAFRALAAPLEVELDDFLRTSADPRHAPGVAELWRRCAAAGDLYRKEYRGRYCVGCEQFYQPEELVDGRCPEHHTEPETVAEQNWFFRLSRHTARLHTEITEGRLRIDPPARRNEVLALLEVGLPDFSVSRSRERARGWGIPVPGDDSQVVYVWWDGLAGYLSALGLGSPDPADARDTPDLRRWWRDGVRRTHLCGKGVLRFHAVYWPAILLSAGLPLPTEVLVHDYLTVGGRKISKSAGTTVDPVGLVAEHGVDAVRWWLLREVAKVGDTDFTVERLVDRANTDLAGGIGNLVKRVVTLIHRQLDGKAGSAAPAAPLPEAVALPGEIAAALDAYDPRRATGALCRLTAAANRHLDRTRPWSDPADAPDQLAVLLHACRTLGEQLAPFLPTAATRILAQCTPAPDGRLPAPGTLFPRL